MLTPSGESPTIREILPQDIEPLRPLLNTWIKDSETGLVIEQEVDESLRAMNAVARGDSSRIYAVAEDAGGVILGVMGLTDASETLAAASP